MSIDGFLPAHRDAFVAFEPRVAGGFYRSVSWLSRRLHVEVRGLENVPAGRSMLVGNHAFGWDAMFPMAEIWRERRRPVWALGEHAWWRVPFLRRLVAAVGTVDGTPENADRLLSHEEIVLVLPGGLREALKPRELRYRLLWGQRYGFVRAAIRNQAPIVPMASVGADDLFDLVGNAYKRGERWLRRNGVPIPLPSRILPIPHFVQLSFIFGEPILPRSGPTRPAIRPWCIDSGARWRALSTSSSRASSRDARASPSSDPAGRERRRAHLATRRPTRDRVTVPGSRPAIGRERSRAPGGRRRSRAAGPP